MMFWRVKRAGRAEGNRVRCLTRDESGVSAIEFALIAPMVFFALLAMVDVGFALRDRMQLDHFLRSGAQAAMRDSGEATVLETLKQTACAATEIYPNCGYLEDVTFETNRYCVCPTSGAIDMTCTSTCPVQPDKFYSLSATKNYEGIFRLKLDFAPSVLVEVR